MAYKHTVADLKLTTLQNVSGMCQDSQAFLNVVNEIQRRLMRRGNWWDTAYLIRLCVSAGCVVWPRYVGTILGARMCDGSVGEIKNRWYSILGGARSLNAAGYGMDLIFEDANPRPTYRDVIPGTQGKRIRYYITKRPDVGKTIKLFGKQYGGQPLQERDADGNWTDGITLTAEADPSLPGSAAESTVYVSSITSVTRDATQGMAYLYELEDDSATLRDLAAYEPSETNPRYRASVIRNLCSGYRCSTTITASGTDYTQCNTSIEALVKLEHFDVTTENDFLLIDNFDAFKLGFQAVKLEEANDDKAAEVKWMKAIRELNFEDRDKNPSAQTTVRVGVANGTMIYNPI